MRQVLFPIERSRHATLQDQICEALSNAVAAGQLSPGEAVPSTRALALALGVSRNTVSLAYQALVDEGILEPRERSGYYIARNVALNTPAPVAATFDWRSRMFRRPSTQRAFDKPRDWRAVPYPFIYGQADPNLFPIGAWRDCVRQAMGQRWLDAWTEDRYQQDDPMLIEQIRRRLLPRRGITAGEDEILITMGAQNALYLIAELLVRPGAVVAMEDPGYADVRNIFALRAAQVRPIPVDESGMRVDTRLSGVDLAYVTPSHQFPSTVTMSRGRRKALLAAASREDFILIEDDYEFETNYGGAPSPALRSLDREGRVIYVGSLSKSLMPGIRVGFLVAPRHFIDEARALRSLILRHPPGNNQRAVALFLSQGHHDTLVSRLHRAYGVRWRVLGDALAETFPGWSRAPSFGGTSYWLQGPEGMDARRLAAEAAARGVLIEPGDVCFADDPAPRQYFRLGFSSLRSDDICEGIGRLRAAFDEIAPGG